jgi:hypothetical protein
LAAAVRALSLLGLLLFPVVRLAVALAVQFKGMVALVLMAAAVLLIAFPLELV